MAPKRKATDTPEDANSTPYHANFPPYPEADLVVESSDKILFATRALYLRAVSSVFDDILGIPSSNEDKKDGLPLIKIEEEGEIFEIFLRYAHRGRHLVDGKAPEPSWKQILLLSRLVDKYDPPNLGRLILEEQLPRFFKDSRLSAPLRGELVVTGTSDVTLPKTVEVFAVA